MEILWLCQKIEKWSIDDETRQNSFRTETLSRFSFPTENEMNDSSLIERTDFCPTLDF